MALQAVLPDYMVPSYYVPLSSFQFTPYGDINTQALPQPEESGLAQASAGQTPEAIVCQRAPETHWERALAVIWQKVLGVETVNCADNFFALGGNSLSAVQMLGLVAEDHAKVLPLKAVFVAHDLAALAKVLGSISSEKASDIPKAARHKKIPLSWVQRRLWFEDRFAEQVEQSAEQLNRVFGTLQLNGELDLSALMASLDAVMDPINVSRPT
jgi:arthrofactin-type cyclic lipopeptide synthetase C